jgi:hypothetical protein
MQAINKMENASFLKIWSNDLEGRNQVGDIEKKIILKTIVEPI